LIAATQAYAQLARQQRPKCDTLELAWPGPSGAHWRSLAGTGEAGEVPHHPCGQVNSQARWQWRIPKDRRGRRIGRVGRHHVGKMIPTTIKARSRAWPDDPSARTMPAIQAWRARGSGNWPAVGRGQPTLSRSTTRGHPTREPDSSNRPPTARARSLQRRARVVIAPTSRTNGIGNMHTF
jgi:hypothetical protein